MDPDDTKQNGDNSQDQPVSDQGGGVPGGTPPSDDQGGMGGGDQGGSMPSDDTGGQPGTDEGSQ